MNSLEFYAVGRLLGKGAFGKARTSADRSRIRKPIKCGHVTTVAVLASRYCIEISFLCSLIGQRGGA